MKKYSRNKRLTSSSPYHTVLKHRIFYQGETFSYIHKQQSCFHLNASLLRGYIVSEGLI